MKRKILCNAKINLNLKVVGKEDNLHLIESVMCPISIYDVMEISESNTFVINGMESVSLQDNILFKTYKLMKSFVKDAREIGIKMTKHIPIGAGLGGGSSNAAFLMCFLNKYWDINMSIEELKKVSKKIGSDVAFFIDNKLSLVTGTGDKIKAIQNNKKIYGVLIFDNDFSSTKEVYDKIDNITLVDANNQLEQGLNEKLAAKIQKIKAELIKEGAITSSMSGSGGSVFGIFKNKEKCKIVEEKLKNKYYFVEAFESI